MKTATASAREPIRPQPGGQEAFASSPADVVIFGGAAGPGKTFALLMESLRHCDNPLFRAVIFRSSYPQITNPGGLWDTANDLYPRFGGIARHVEMRWDFPGGASISFRHLDSDQAARNWQGSQVALFEFDELTEITEWRFFFLLSRLRSMSGVKPYVRATCNPDPDSWVAKFISWWLDEATGFPIAKRAGVLRWMLRAGDELHWFDSEAEALGARVELGLPDDVEPKSVTFIPASLDENKILLATNPGYRANLYALPLVERERLLKGNWKIRAQAGLVFQRGWFETVVAAPAEAERIRFWDLAATEVTAASPDPDWTVGVKLARAANGIFYVEDVVRLRASSWRVEETIKNTATEEPDVAIGFFQDPGQAGKAQIAYLTRQLAGFKVKGYPITGDKLTLAGPVSAQAEAGNVKIVRGNWNKPFLDTLEAFDGAGKVHDDDVDGLSGGFNALAKSRQRWVPM